jgi:aspartate-semialdehyde dehydrogenase
MRIGDLYKLRKEEDTILIVPKVNCKVLVPEKKWKFRLRFKK